MAPAPRGSEHASPGRARRWRFLGAEEGNEVRGAGGGSSALVSVLASSEISLKEPYIEEDQSSSLCQLGNGPFEFL